MSPGRPISNALALVVTLVVALIFFGLLMVMPSHKTKGTTRPSAGNTAAPVVSDSARNLFVNRCTQCHALPVLTHRTRQDWRILVLKMNRYMQQTGHRFLSGDQTELVTQYILQHRK